MSRVRSRWAAAIAAVAASVLMAAGCGSSSSGPGAGSTTATTTASTAAASAAATVSITDAQGRTVEVPTNPRTVVAIDWSVIRTLRDLGVEVDAVPTPNGSLPADLAAYNDATKVGTLFEPDYEAISALKPDLVIVGSRSGTPEVVKEFERFAPVVIDMSVRSETPADTLKLTRERVIQLGSIFGKQEQASALMDRIAADIATIKSTAEKQGATAMVVQVSDGTVSAYGPGSRFGSVFQDFGFTPTSAPIDDEGGHGEEISQEFFVQYNPGVLFVLDRAKAIGQKQAPALDVLDNGLVRTTDAAKNERIVEIDGFSWYIASSAPSSWQQMVKDVQGAI